MLNRRFMTPNVWEEMERFQREMNRLFDDTFTRWPSLPGEFPAVNIWIGDEGVILTTEVPGLNPEDIDISVVGQTVTISGNREAENVDQETRYHRQERPVGKFARSIELPFMVNANQVQATFENGVLYIKMPRAEAEKPKKITIKASA